MYVYIYIYIYIYICIYIKYMYNIYALHINIILNALFTSCIIFLLISRTFILGIH